MPPRNLVVRAGAKATERLRAEGFHPDLFGTLVGASGGPKWLVLRHLDEVLIDRLVTPRRTPLDTLGSSIGSFRHACLAQASPGAALARFADAYVHQAYEEGRPSMEAISRESDRILEILLGEKGAAEIVSNARIRSHLVAARLRSGRDHDRGLRFRLELGRAALANLASRRHLGRYFERILFGPPSPSLRFDDFETVDHLLEPANLRSALLASGSIPLLMEGVRSLPELGGPLFDGGILDYHFDFRFRRQPGLVLFPHFFDAITPGWFDKWIRGRRPRSADLDDVVMVAPSDAFVSALPGGKVPDRNDFLELDTASRIRRWESVQERSRSLADEWIDLIDGGGLGDVAANRLPHIAASTGHSIAEVGQAIELLRTLDPCPGSAYGEAPAEVIRPEVVVEEIDGIFQVRLTRERDSGLRISADYTKLLRETPRGDSTCKWIRQHLGSARWFINALEQRQDTLLRISCAIFDRQGNFLEKGQNALEPMCMHEVADAAGVHLSTVTLSPSSAYGRVKTYGLHRNTHPT